MATIEKRGRSWCVRYRQYDEYGKAKFIRKSGFATKSDAMAAVRDLERASRQGVDVNPGQLTVGVMLENHFLDASRRQQATTLASRSNALDQLKKRPIYDMQIKKLRPETLSILADDMIRGTPGLPAISTTTARGYTSIVVAALRWGVKKGILQYNPCEGADLPPKARPKQVILSMEDVAEVCTVCAEYRPYFLPMIYLAAYGGLRREECAGLLWSAFDPARGSVQITTVTASASGRRVKKEPKSASSRRTVILPKFVADYLRQLPHKSDYICAGDRSDSMHPNRYSAAIHKIQDEVNRRREAEGREPLPSFRFHDLRHTHAAMCIAAGVHPKVISERLGHSSVSITMDVYGYLMPGAQEAVAATLDALAGGGANAV